MNTNQEYQIENKEFLYKTKLKKLDVMDFMLDSLENINGDNNLFFLTLRFSRPQKSIEMAANKLRKILGGVHLNLQGRSWYKKPFNSISIIEHGKYLVLHVHTIINIQNKDINDLTNAFIETSNNMPWLNLVFDVKEGSSNLKPNFNINKNHMYITEVDDFNYLSGYLIKEYNFKKQIIDFSNLYTQDMLFNNHR